ncbi:MAG: LysR family transcriptional regulator [Saprospiraceae bacterium]|nr:LysR family transcriptional regulator [Saprospiraceae bacterium]
MKKINKQIEVVFRLWFYSNKDKFLGKGRVELLQRIDDTGSLAKAAEGMKMSYRQAWQMLKEINERAPVPIVEKHLGGKNGGGTIITKEGKKAIKTFVDFELKVAEFIKKEIARLKF